MAKPMGTFIEKSKQENCPYCHTKQVIHVRPDWTVAVNPLSRSLHVISSTKVVCFDIKFCPMCGRLLNDNESIKPKGYEEELSLN